MTNHAIYFLCDSKRRKQLGFLTTVYRGGRTKHPAIEWIGCGYMDMFGNWC